MMSMKRMLCGAACISLSLSGRASGLEQYAPSSLNPVRLEVVKDAVPLDLVKGAVIVIPERGGDHALPHVMYCGNGNVPYDKSTRALELAASELSGFIERSSGIKVPVIRDNEVIPAGKIPVFVGMGKGAEKYGIDDSGIRPEGFRVVNTGKAVGIIGAKPGKMSNTDGVAATLFGVYDFLERFAGIRFYYPDEGVIVPKRDSLVVPPVKYEDYPRHDHRYAHSWTWREFPGNCATLSALRWRSGGHGWGTLAVFQHVPSDISLMFDKESDQDCLQLNADGRRSSTIPPVPCYSNPKTFEYLIRAYRSWESDPLARKAMGHAFPNQYALGFGFPDHLIECHCAECLKSPPDKSLMFWEEGSEFAGHLAQKLSWKFKELFPEKRFYYLPYYTYSMPPRTGKFADNTHVRLCMMLGTKMYLDPFIQKKYDEWVDGWIKATGHPISVYLYAWQDIKPNHPLPYQYYRAWKKFFQNMRGRVTGAFSCSLDRDISGGLPSNYALFRVMWNPDFDVDAAIDEMYALLFGPAAPHMKKLYDRLTENFEKSRVGDFKDALNGAPYTAPLISEAEVYEKLCTAADIKLIREELAAAEKKLVNADDLYKKRYAYFSEAFKLTLKRHEFFQAGGATDTKTMIAKNVSGSSAKMKIDGKLDESVWKDVQNGAMERAEMVLGNTAPDQATDIRIIRLNSMNPQEGGLLIGMRMNEPKMDSRKTDAHDMKLWEGDSIEILFDATPEADGKPSRNFIQYLISSDGRILRGDGKELSSGNPQKWAYGVHRDSDSWTAELFIPFSGIFRDINPDVRANTRLLKANFVRNRVLKEDNGKTYRFMSRWRTNFGGSNLDTRAFGEVVTREDSGRFGTVKALSPVRVSERPVIDGKFDEAAWGKARPESMSRYPLSLSNPEPEQQSTFRVLRYDHPGDARQSGYVFAFRMNEPAPEQSVLNFGPKELHKCDNVEFFMESLAHSPYFVRYIFTLDGRDTHFGNKAPEFKVHREPDAWNLEFFVPFTSVFSWTNPSPGDWTDNADIRFNFIRQRRNKAAAGAEHVERSRWNVSSMDSPFDPRGFGKITLEPLAER